MLTSSPRNSDDTFAKTLKTVFHILCIGFGFIVAGKVSAQVLPESPLPEQLSASETESPNVEHAGIDLYDALILGLVEGITEYLPVSSTGHLILTNRFLGLDVETPLPSLHDGSLVMIEGENGERPFMLKDAADGYAIIIQGGAILAVAILYWQRLMKAFFGGIGLGLVIAATVFRPARELAGRFAVEDIQLARNLIVAFLPAAVLGLLLDDWIESRLFGPMPVVAALIFGSFLMLGVEFWRKRSGKTVEDTGPDLPELTIQQSLTIGFLQCVAMWPGTSRSMMTIVGGYMVGLSPVRAAEFSFLLGFITLTAASAYKTLKVGGDLAATLDLVPMLVGILVATVSAMMAIRWLVGYLTRHGLAIFAWYRLLLAGVVFWLIG